MQLNIQPSEFWRMTPAELCVLWDYRINTDPAYKQYKERQELYETLMAHEELL